MIKIAYLVSRLNKGGPNQQLFYICKYLEKQSVKFIVITLEDSNNENTYYQDLIDLGIPVISISEPQNHLNIFKSIRKIQQIINSQGVQIIQSYGFRADFIASRLKNVIRITTIRERSIINYQNLYGKVVGWFVCKYKFLNLKSFDQIVACSDSVRLYLEQNHIRSEAIIDAIEPEGKVDYAAKQHARSGLKIPFDTGIYITISSRLPGKNIGFLLEYFTRNDSNGILLVAGHVSLDCKAKYQHNDRIKFLGWIDNITEYFRASDYFISASYSEGMPNAVLEAMNQGTPVILSDIPSHLEIIDSVDYSVGITFINNDFIDLGEKVARINGMDYKMLMENCQKCIKDRYSAKYMSLAYQKLYSQALN